MRGAAPGSILVLAATILLLLVTISVPILKSIDFLTATVGGSGTESGATLKFGTLGYCIDSKCAGPTIGYSFDPTQVLGIATSVEGISFDSSKYSTAVIKALTYTLILHPIALAACVLTLITGLLANCGDMSLKCLNSVFSSLASFITLVAVGCDFALFLIAKKRINDVSGASASLGIALWLTLVAWILIVISSFFFCCGSSGRGSGGGGKRNKNRDDYDDDAWKSGRMGGGGNGSADQMRMDALDAESQRKNRSNNLPQFATYETEHIESVPLKHDYENQMAAGAAGFAAGHQGGHGYGNQYGYADAGYADYTPGSEHGPYAYGGGGAGGYQSGGAGNPMDSYIPGVGPGAQRAVPAATAYQDAQYHPHSQSTHEGPSSYPGYHDDEFAYGGPQRAPSWSSHLSRQPTGDYGMESAPPVPAIPSNYANGRQPSQDFDQYASAQGHQMEYSGATFGGNNSPYDAVQQATAAGQRSRVLPVPGPDRQSSIAYTPTSPDLHQGAHDGFGLPVLQAGAAAAAVGSSSNNRFGGNEQPTSPTGYSSYDARSPSSRPLPSAPFSGHQYGQELHSEPPEYESEHGAAYGGYDIHSRNEAYGRH